MQSSSLIFENTFKSFIVSENFTSKVQLNISIKDIYHKLNIMTTIKTQVNYLSI
jgi:hypothetical protein